MNPNKKNRGLTLVETLLGVAVMVILFGLSAVFYQSFQIKNDLDITGNVISQSLRRAQALSQASQEDATWGIYIETGRVTLFKGVSYIARDTDNDEFFDIPLSIKLSGLSEVVFDKLTGYPQATGVISLATPINDTMDITINQRGMISY